MTQGMNGRTKTVSVPIREAGRKGGESGQSGRGQKEEGQAESLEVRCASEQPHLRHTTVERDREGGAFPQLSPQETLPLRKEGKARA